MSGMTEMITAGIIGALIILISFVLEENKRKKLLSNCAADQSCTDTFEYKGRLYSKELYIKFKTKDFMKVHKKDLTRNIKSYQKSKAKGKLSEIQLLDLEAMIAALENK